MFPDFTMLKMVCVLIVQTNKVTRSLNKKIKNNKMIDNFCIALFSGVPKLTALYILQHLLSFTNIIHIIIVVVTGRS